MATSEPVPRALPGDVLADKYRVERVLGQGGMGMVIAARHVQLGTRVALKFLLPSALGSQDTVARFLREAQTASLIASEHVTRVLDVGTLADGSPFIVMEHLDGQDLASLVRQRGCLPIADAIDYTLQVCEALAVAHAAGIVHRDLKPANLFLTVAPDGSPLIKILDFGISKKHGLEGDFALTRTDAAIMGSPAYISPEQIRSQKNVDGRADIWSLGVSLYELLSGQLPFMAENLGGLIAAILADPPVPLRAQRPEVSPELEAVVNRCIEKSTTARPANVALLAQELRPFGSARGAASADRAIGVVTRSTGGSLLSVQAVSRAQHVPAPAPPPRARPGEDPTSTRRMGSAASQPSPSAAAPPEGPAPRASLPSYSGAPEAGAANVANTRTSSTELYVAPQPAAPPGPEAAKATSTEIYRAPAAAAPSPAPPAYPPPVGGLSPAPSPSPGAAPATATAASVPSAAARSAVPPPAPSPAAPLPTVTSGAWGHSSPAIVVPAPSRKPVWLGAAAGVLLVPVAIWLLLRSPSEPAPAAASSGTATAASPALPPSAEAPASTETPAPTEAPAAPTGEPSSAGSAAPAAATPSSAPSTAAKTAAAPSAAGGPKPGGAGTKPRTGAGSSDINKLIQNRR